MAKGQVIERVRIDHADQRGGGGGQPLQLTPSRRPGNGSRYVPAHGLSVDHRCAHERERSQRLDDCSPAVRDHGRAGPLGGAVELAGDALPIATPMPDFDGLAGDLAAAWSAPGVTTRARQQLIRALVADIIADIDEATHEVVLTIHWRGGQHSQLRVFEPKTGEHNCQIPPRRRSP